MGPYYKAGAPKMEMLRAKGDEGLPMVVEGRLLGADSNPLKGAALEVWHADPEGKYDAEEFHYRATIPVDREGHYRFETVLPGHYGMRGYGIDGDDVRPQHIHYRVVCEGYRELVTQLYFETDPFFEGNPEGTLKKDPIVKYRKLIVPVQVHRKAKVYSASALFDVVLKKA
jgi:protocatechuate 3,4-dioxygenase beta subunit